MSHVRTLATLIPAPQSGDFYTVTDVAAIDELTARHVVKINQKNPRRVDSPRTGTVALGKKGFFNPVKVSKAEALQHLLQEITDLKIVLETKRMRTEVVKLEKIIEKMEAFYKENL